VYEKKIAQVYALLEYARDQYQGTDLALPPALERALRRELVRTEDRLARLHLAARGNLRAWELRA
jgi:hypothetical protein